MDTISKTEAKRLSPGLLAFYGDSVYEIMVRRYVVSSGDKPSAKLHEQSVKYARAGFQAAGYETILPMLTEDEKFHGTDSSEVKQPSRVPQGYRGRSAVRVSFTYRRGRTA